MKTITVLLAFFAITMAKKLEERFAWNVMEYDWPNSDVMEHYIKTGKYIKDNNLPLGLEVWGDKMFITVPRWKAGVASSLNYIDLNSKDKSPKLRPYPSWEANELPIEGDAPKLEDRIQTAAGRDHAAKPVAVGDGLKDNSTIISTFRVQADECNRLWVMDTGLADILGKPNQIAPPAIVVFDLKTDQLLRRYDIPKEQIKEDTFFANIVVESDADDCGNSFAYVPDLGSYGLVVYSLNENKSWRVKHNFFHFDPLNGDFNIGGVNFQWTDGLFALAIGDKKSDGTRDIWFHPLASTKEFVVSNKVLQNETHVTGLNYYYDFKLIGDRGLNGQSSAEVYDKKTQNIFYTQLNKDAIGCWNTNKEYRPDSAGLVDSDSNALIFPNDLKVDKNGNLWVLSDRLPNFIYKTLDNDDVNYRIMRGTTSEIIKGTPCEN
ncbi:L-dopachrome tautomerase yellow-f2 [Condylostylus longicornis]|uniref:L-dopachrome tautomerase yellow-f2 n=1 Tax=Condylostylus longicornis TaxID=2530218 RepID=UPI00244E3615|nr:L-dopachrome tautomerase yellow-f2 [Condylostylus longicornis]